MEATQIINIHEALKKSIAFLADNDPDFAEEKNFVGFNKPDSYFGHKMSGIEKLSFDEATKAYKLLRKYSGQLGDIDVDIISMKFDSINEREYYLAIWGEDRPAIPTRAVRKARAEGWILKVIVNGQRPILLFPYDPVLKDKVKAIKDARFEGQGKSWSIPDSLENRSKLEEIFNVSLDYLPEYIPTVDPVGTRIGHFNGIEVKVFPVGDKTAIVSPYNPDFINKKIASERDKAKFAFSNKLSLKDFLSLVDKYR